MCIRLLDLHCLNLKSLLSMNTDDSRLADARLLADVLMAVKEQARLDATNVTNKCLEAQMNVIVSVVNVAWRIVSDEHINRRKSRKKLCDLILIVEKVTSRLVSPRTAETAKSQAAETLCAKMQVNNGSRKRTSAVVIAFNGENARALHHLCSLQNDQVCHVTARNQNVRTLTRRSLRERVVVRYDEDVHDGLTL